MGFIFFAPRALPGGSPKTGRLPGATRKLPDATLIFYGLVPNQGFKILKKFHDLNFLKMLPRKGGEGESPKKVITHNMKLL